MKKKYIILPVIVLFLAAVFTGAALLFGMFDSRIASGKYYITDSDDYSNAYLKVEGDKVQFFNIDLNKIYRETKLSELLGAHENGALPGYTEDELYERSDLNKMFVEHPYAIDYDHIDRDSAKTDASTYIYFCMDDQNISGLVLEYDPLKKTVKITGPKVETVFKK